MPPPPSTLHPPDTILYFSTFSGNFSFGDFVQLPFPTSFRSTIQSPKFRIQLQPRTFQPFPETFPSHRNQSINTPPTHQIDPGQLCGQLCGRFGEQFNNSQWTALERFKYRPRFARADSCVFPFPGGVGYARRVPGTFSRTSL